MPHCVLPSPSPPPQKGRGMKKEKLHPWSRQKFLSTHPLCLSPAPPWGRWGGGGAPAGREGRPRGFEDRASLLASGAGNRAADGHGHRTTCPLGKSPPLLQPSCYYFTDVLRKLQRRNHNEEATCAIRRYRSCVTVVKAPRLCREHASATSEHPLPS